MKHLIAPLFLCSSILVLVYGIRANIKNIHSLEKNVEFFSSQTVSLTKENIKIKEALFEIKKSLDTQTETNELIFKNIALRKKLEK